MTTTIASVLDADAHEMVPGHLWGEIFGDAMGELGRLAEPLLRKTGAHDMYNPTLRGDEQVISDESVWHVRGTNAPSAIDLARRVEVMDVMGVDRQLIFPTAALLAIQLLRGTESTLRMALDLRHLTPSGIVDLGRTALEEYNAFAVRTTRIDPARIRAVAYLDPTLDVTGLEAQARALVAEGIRAVHLNSGSPPGGVSPAHPDLDPLWGFLAEHDIATTIHLGGEQGFLDSSAWVKAPAFAPGKVESHEIGLEPYSFATLHLSASNWLTCMILGGVFERHPALRFGTIETGAAWFGPLMDGLDMWARDVYARRLEPFISMLPSEYAARNVRVTPFNNFERPAEYIEAYPRLRDCYCFSTDFPHIEGGTDSKRKMLGDIGRLGDDAVRRFFVDNASLLLPD